MRRYSFILVNIILVLCVVFASGTPSYAQRYNNNFYWQQQQMRQQQMMQQQRQQEAMRQQQAQMRRQQEIMRQRQLQQQQAMRQRQQEMQRQMRQRQQQAMQQRQRMAERQRQAQQQRKLLQKQQKSQNQRQQVAKQQRTLQQRQMLRQQRLMKDRQKRLNLLQKNRLQRQAKDKNKKEASRRALTMAALLSRQQMNRVNPVNTPQKKALNQSAKQFQQKKQLQKKQQRITKLLDKQRMTTQTRMRKMRETQKRFLAKKQIEKRQQKQKQAQKQKSAQNNFGCSFHGDTQVLTKEGFEPIRSLIAGEDHVFARNEYTGDTGWKPIIGHHFNEYQETVTITIQNAGNGETQAIVSNRIHPFYVSNFQSPHEKAGLSSAEYGTNNTGQWVQAQNLRRGDFLLTDSGHSAKVIDLEIKDEYLKAYNITVDQYHTYFVRGVVNDNAPAVWVHNGCFEISKISPDWASKGAHVKIHGIEIALKPDHKGGIALKSVFSKDSNTRKFSHAVKKLENSLKKTKNRKIIHKEVVKAIDYLKGMDRKTREGKLAEKKMAELHFLRVALEKKGIK